VLAFSFAYRYLRAKKSANAINIISWVCVAAIAVGTAAMVIIMSVFNGFEDMVKSLYGTFYADIRIIPASGKFFMLSDEQLQKISSVSNVSNATPVLEEKAILQNGKEQSIISLKGVNEQYGEVARVSHAVIKGRFDVGTAGQPSLVLGAGVEIALQLDAVKAVIPVTVYLPKQTRTSALSQDNLSIANIAPSGTFAIQDEFNNKYAFTNIHFMNEYLDLPAGTYSAAEVFLQKGTNENEVKQQIQLILGKAYKAETRYEQNKVLYAAMQLEKWLIFAVLSLIMVIFSFTVVSTLSMLVIEKQKDISVLKSMGAGNVFIKKVFLSQGFFLSGIGVSGGLIIALLVCYLQMKYKIIKLAGSSFLIDYYPVKILPSDLIVIVLTVVLITLIAALLPASKAANRAIELKGAE
jgi:lipoprotein-releasing system permease protein